MSEPVLTFKTKSSDEIQAMSQRERDEYMRELAIYIRKIKEAGGHLNRKERREFLKEKNKKQILQGVKNV